MLLAHERQDQMHGPGGAGMMFAEAATNADPAVRKAGQRAHARTLQALIGILRRGQREGSIRDDVDATPLGWLVLSQIHARQFRRAHSETSPTTERALLDALLVAFRPPQRA